MNVMNFSCLIFRKKFPNTLNQNVSQGAICANTLNLYTSIVLLISNTTLIVNLMLMTTSNFIREKQI